MAIAVILGASLDHHHDHQLQTQNFFSQYKEKTRQNLCGLFHYTLNERERERESFKIGINGKKQEQLKS